MEPFLHLLRAGLDHQRLKMRMEQLCELNPDGCLIQKSAASANGSRRIPLVKVTPPSSSWNGPCSFELQIKALLQPLQLNHSYS